MDILVEAATLRDILAVLAQSLLQWARSVLERAVTLRIHQALGRAAIHCTRLVVLRAILVVILAAVVQSPPSLLAPLPLVLSLHPAPLAPHPHPPRAPAHRSQPLATCQTVFLARASRTPMTSFADMTLPPTGTRVRPRLAKSSSILSTSPMRRFLRTGSLALRCLSMARCRVLQSQRAGETPSLFTSTTS